MRPAISPVSYQARVVTIRVSLTALILGAAIAAVLPITGCGAKPSGSAPASVPLGPEWFADVTDEVGLDFVHQAGPTETYFMPQQVGSGAAIFSLDAQGTRAIYLLQNAGPGTGVTNRLYRQLPNGHFEDVSKGSGLDIDGYSMGVAVGDVNNDGLADVLVTQYGGGARLFLNQGQGKFLEVTKEAGLSNPGWGTSAAFVDYDRDGYLDLVVVNYVDYDPTWPCQAPNGKPDYCSPKTFHGRVSRLFHNLGGKGRDSIPGSATPGVRFEDVTEPSGLGSKPGPGLGVVCADFDGDGWPDIFIANDGAANHLWMNQRDGTFREQAVQCNVALNGMGQAQAGMGVALGDVNGDGLFDLFVTHLTEETNTLWRQGPRGQFRDATVLANLAAPAWRGTGFGTLLADFDNDGAPDLAIVNGRVAARTHVQDESLGPFWSRYGDRNQLFHNDGTGKFRDISPRNSAFCGRMNAGRGLVRCDFDGDGGVDLLVTAIAGRARLFRNITPARGHWVQIRAVDPELHRDALGSEVRLRAAGRTRVCWLQSAESYLCSSEPVAHFGLGPTAEFDAIEVTWPGGSVEEFAGGPADRKITVEKGKGRIRNEN
jgi:enediyne biosynthesis protein E4